MRQKSNLWPIGIIGAFVIFIAGTTGLVVLACSQRVDLVSSDYYEKEVKFQNQIDRLNRTQSLGTTAEIGYDATNGIIDVHLPPTQVGQVSNGRIELYRPSSSILDRRLDLRLDAQGIQVIDVRDLAAGLWKIRVSWSANDKDFLIDQPVVLKRPSLTVPTKKEGLENKIETPGNSPG